MKYVMMACLFFFMSVNYSIGSELKEIEKGTNFRKDINHNFRYLEEQINKLKGKKWTTNLFSRCESNGI